MNRIKRFATTLAHNKLLVGVAIVALLMVAQPSSNPLTVQTANGATYAHQGFAQWRMEEPSSLGGLFAVKGAVDWTTSDPSAPCIDTRRPTGLLGVTQTDAIDYPSIKCPWSHEYPMSVGKAVCWVSKAIFVSVQIDSCDLVPSWWNSAPYFYTVGIHFRACVGIINTPFSVCDSYTSLLHLGGSQVWVQYQNG
jgi:hypothetical protein